MSTLRQIEANRRNAQKSTGPTSVTGKAASSMNALKSGIHAKSLVLPSEKLADLEQLIDAYYQRHLPDSPHTLFHPPSTAPPPTPAPPSMRPSPASGSSAATAPPKPKCGNTRLKAPTPT